MLKTITILFLIYFIYEDYNNKIDNRDSSIIFNIDNKYKEFLISKEIETFLLDKYIIEYIKEESNEECKKKINNNNKYNLGLYKQEELIDYSKVIIRRIDIYEEKKLSKNMRCLYLIDKRSNINFFISNMFKDKNEY